MVKDSPKATKQKVLNLLCPLTSPSPPPSRVVPGRSSPGSYFTKGNDIYFAVVLLGHVYGMSTTILYPV